MSEEEKDEYENAVGSLCDRLEQEARSWQLQIFAT